MKMLYVVDKYHRLLDKFKEHVNDVFRRPFRDKLPLRCRAHAINSTFSSMQLFLDHKEVNIHAIFESFFEELFPSVYYYLSLNASSESDIEPAYRDCLARIYQQLNPRPFKDAASSIAHRLKKGLTITRTFLHALHEGSQIVNSTLFVTMDTQCLAAMTRLQYCSRCHGYVNIQPCTKFCLNVMRGCLAQVITINSRWNSYMHTFLHMAGTLSYASHNLEQLLLGLLQQIHKAIEHSRQNVFKYHQQVIFATVVIFTHTEH